MAEDSWSKYQQIISKQTRATFKKLTVSQVIKTRPNTYVLCIPPGHKQNKRKHPLQLLCQTPEKQPTPTSKQVCIHNDWWTKIIWNKDKECYYTNRLLKQLHNHDDTDSKEESQDEPEILEEATVNQEIRQTPINPTICTSPLITTSDMLPVEQSTMSTQTITATSTMTTSAFGMTPTLQQRIASAMQQVLQGKGKGKGTGPPSRGGPLGGGGGGPPSGGGGGPLGGVQPAATQQPIAPAADVKAMGSLPQIFTGDQSKADDFIEEVKGYFCLNADVAGYNSPYKKVTFTLTLIKGTEPAQWVQNMGDWLDTLDPVADNIEDLWTQFLEEYNHQFQDSQATQRAWNELKNCRMTNNNYNNYVSRFEALANKANYTRGSAEMYDMFLKGLPTNFLYNSLKPPTLTTYDALKERVKSLA